MFLSLYQIVLGWVWYFILLYTYTCITLDTKPLVQPYRPRQIELSSHECQKSRRGLLWGLIRGPSSAVDLTLEKKQGISAKGIVKKESGRILAYFYLMPTQFALKTTLKHININFLTPIISIQNGVSFKLYNVTTTSKLHAAFLQTKELKK